MKKKFSTILFRILFPKLYKELEEKRKKVKILSEENNSIKLSIKEKLKECKKINAKYKKLKNDCLKKKNK